MKTCTFVTPRGGTRTAAFTDQEDLDQLLANLCTGSRTNGVLYRGSLCYSTAALCDALDTPKAAMYPYDTMSPRSRHMADVQYSVSAFGSGVTLAVMGTLCLSWAGYVLPGPLAVWFILCAGLYGIYVKPAYTIGPATLAASCLSLCGSRLWSAQAVHLTSFTCKSLPLGLQVRLCPRTQDIAGGIQLYCAQHPLRDVLGTQPSMCESVLLNETSHLVTWCTIGFVVVTVYRGFGYLGGALGSGLIGRREELHEM